MAGFYCGGDYCIDDYSFGDNYYSGVPVVGIQYASTRIGLEIYGFQYVAETAVSPLLGVYCGGDYGVDDYCFEGANHFFKTRPLGVGFRNVIAKTYSVGMEVSFTIKHDATLGFYCGGDYGVDDYCLEGSNHYLKANATSFNYAVAVHGVRVEGFDSTFSINAKEVQALGTKFFIDKTRVKAFDFNSVRKYAVGLQFRSFLYNLKQIRFLYDYKSRGLTGLDNWTVTSTATGDFHANNLNTDIVEQKWRSAGDVIVTLVSDTQIPQGVEVDTLAILNHNFTRGSRVTLIGSTLPDFSEIDFLEILPYTPTNIFYVFNRPSKPIRYWRFDIEDLNNPLGFIEIGAIVFGSSDVFTLSENFNGSVTFEKRVYTDKVVTEGYTNVENVRNRSNVLSLQFSDLKSDGYNYKVMQNMFEVYQTTHKILVIPYPATPERFSVFAKLEQLPVENHYQEGESIVDFNIVFDEGL